MSKLAESVQNAILDILPTMLILLFFAAVLFSVAAILSLWSGSLAMRAMSIGLPICASLIIGTAASYLLPVARAIDPLPGSRYVPQKSQRREASITASFKSLRMLPIRQVFAQATPKRIARSLMVILLSIGLQTFVDGALITIGICAMTGIQLLLALSLISTTLFTQSWLQPLPICPSRIILRAWYPSLAVTIGGSIFELYLLSLKQMSFALACKIVVIVLLGILLVAIGGSLVAVRIRRHCE
jgi:hypothetical protein